VRKTILNKQEETMANRVRTLLAVVLGLTAMTTLLVSCNQQGKEHGGEEHGSKEHGGTTDTKEHGGG